MNFLNVMNAFKQAKNISELYHLLKLYLTAQGFSGYSFSYFGKARSKVNQLNHEVVSDRMKTWHDYYHEEDCEGTDTTHYEAYNTLLPVYWKTCEQLKNARTDKERRMREESIKFGVMRGLSMPLHGPQGDFAELALREFVKETCMVDWENKQAEWYIISLGYFNHLRELMLRSEVEKASPFTKREQQCLNCLGQGYPLSEIARTLNMMERTVNFHIQNINHKLKVRNKYEAVSKARDLGLIQ